MNIIDDKGRLFGKINVIDFFAVMFLLLFLIPMFYFGYNMFNRPILKLPEFKKTDIIVPIDIYAVFKNLTPGVAAMISAGDREFGRGGILIGEVMEVVKSEPNFLNIKLGEVETLTKQDSQRKQVTLKLRLICKFINGDILYKESRVKIGYNIDLKTNKYEIKGLILPEPIESEFISGSGVYPITLDAQFINLNPEVANLISVGDFEADNEGKTIAKILRIGPIEPYAYKVDLGKANYVTKIDPQKKQVQVKLEILGGVYGNIFYFKGERIALDSEFMFNTYKYNVKGLIVREPVMVKSSPKIPITLDAQFINLIPEVANLISVGDFEADNEGNTIAKILRIGPIEPYAYKVDLGKANYVTKIDPQKKQVQVKLEIFGGVYGNIFYFKGERIALDSEFMFNTYKYNVKGLIVREPVMVKKVEKKWLLIKVKFVNLTEDLVNIIKAGDEEMDSSGELIARIDSVASVEPTKVKYIDIINNTLLFTENNQNKDVVLSISANCTKTNNTLFFKEYPMKVSKDIFFQTSKYDIAGKVVEIKD